MRRSFTILVVLLTIFSFSLLFAQHPIFEENFDYPANDLLTDHGWTAHSGTGTNPITVVSPGLSYSGYPSSNIGNAALLDNTGEDVNRTFTPFTSGVFYVSFMVNVTSGGAADGYFLLLGADPIGTSFRGRVYVLDVSGSLEFGLSQSSGTAQGYTSNGYSYGTTYLLVIKYEFITGTGNDEVSLFIFDGAIPAAEPVTPDLGPFAGTDLSSIASIGLRQYDSNQNITVDGIRIGPSWQLDAPLPISLTSFTARAGDRLVTLRWVTQSEQNNVGFEIMRSNEKDGNYDLLSSYVNNEALKGQLNSSKQTAYKFTDKLVGNDITYWYKLVDVDLNGVKTFHGPLSATPHAVGNEIVNTTPGNFPKEFALQQNYPNPFNPNTTLSFDIPQLSSGNVDATLYIYNSLGQQVKVLYQGKIAAGIYTVEWDGTNESGLPLPSGIYYAILKADYFVKTIKMMYLK